MQSASATETYVIGDGPHSFEVLELLSESGITARSLGKHEEVSMPVGAMAFLGVGRPLARLRAFERLRGGASFGRLVSSYARIAPSASIGEGTFIAFGVVVSSRARIGDGVLVNWNATIGHDVEIGVCSVISPLAAISGGVNIGRGCLIGAGAVVLENISIGDGAVVGAGAVVTKPVPAESTVVGVPASSLHGRAHG